MTDNKDNLKIIGKNITTKIADAVFQKSQENLATEGHSDTGFLLRSGKRYEEADGSVIEYDAPYARAVHDGSKPHAVSHKRLIGWVKRKLHIKNEKEAISVAYAIAAKIKERGTKPYPFLKSAVANTNASLL